MKWKVLAFSLVLALLSVLITSISVNLIKANPDSSSVIESFNASSSGDWPLFRYDAANSGSPDNIAPATHDLLWSIDLLIDQNAFSIVGSSPAIVDDVVYIGSDDGYMYALNAYSGIQLWNSSVDGSSVSSPVVVDGIVYFRTWYGMDYALNASTGEKIWSFSAGWSYSSPAVVNGVYYARTIGNVTAVNASTGSLIWRSSLWGNGDGTPILVDNTIYISESGYVHALNAQNGTSIWNRDLLYGSNTDNAPTVVNGILYISCSSDLFYALDAKTGEPIWNYTTGSSCHSIAAVSDGVVYLGSGHQGVFALNALTGSKIWNYPTSPGMGSSVAVAGRKVYFAGNDGVMYSLDAATGTKIWSYTMSNDGTSSSPTIANGILYIRNTNGYLCAFGKATQAAISISPALGLAGTITTLSGSGFTADSTITTTLNGTIITLTNSNVDLLGHFSTILAIPPFSLPGKYQVIVSDSSGLSASSSFKVVAAAATSWPMFMHDLQHSGTSDNISPISNNLLWKFSVDKGEIMNAVCSSAAIVGGIVYESSQNGFVYALDAYTGTYYWRFNLGSSTLSSPAVLDGVVYIGSIHGVYAINAYTGEKIWQSSSRISALDSSPAISNGIVYTGSFVEHSVYAFRASDGQQLWTFATGDYVNSSPSVVDNVVYICSDDGYLYALNAATGSLIWKFNCIENYPYESLSSSPTVANGVVYVTSSKGNLFAIDVLSGNKIWNHTTADLSSFTSSPIYSNGIVYTSTERGVYALNTTTGQEIWHSMSIFAQASPAIVGGVIYVGTGDGNIYALDALTGAKIWQYTTDGFIRGQTAIAGGIIYVGTGKGTIYALGTPINSPLPSTTPTPTPSPTPVSTSTISTFSTNTNPPTQNPTSTTEPTIQPTPTITITPDQTATQEPTSKINQDSNAPISTTVLIVSGIGGSIALIGSAGFIHHNHKKINAVNNHKE